MRWTLLDACLPGTSHRNRNIPCQDAFRTRVFGPAADSLVVAVADGAGSSTLGDVGASIACEILIEQVEIRNSDAIWTQNEIIELFSQARKALDTEASKRGVPPRELACTLLLAVVSADAATFAQLGDGAIVAGQEDNYRTIFWPEPVEYANATDFLTDDNFAQSIQYELISEPITQVALLTDGLQRIALDYSNRTAFSGFFQPLFARLRAEAQPNNLREPFHQFLDSSRVNDRTDDDKTLVLAIRQANHESTTLD